MRQKLVSFVGSAALAVAALLASGPAASAQHGGGGHGGGHSGGAYYGGSRGGFSGGHYGGFYGHPGYGGHYGGYGYGYPFGGIALGFGLGYGGYGGGYYDGGYPSYYGAPAYYNNPGYAYPPANYDPTFAGVQTQSAYAPSAIAPTQAKVVVRLPANAQLWVDDYQSQQSGPVRELTTPATLEPGKPYHYTLKAQWTQDGQPVTQERKVTFQAGQRIAVDLTQAEQGPAPTAPPVPATPPAATPPTTPPVTPPANIPAI
jgi:uncharacterized protein (TIGR03000 family)